MEELCKKGAHRSVFVSDGGHPCRCEGVCEVAPVLRPHSANFKFGGQKKGGRAPLKSAGRAQPGKS